MSAETALRQSPAFAQSVLVVDPDLKYLDQVQAYFRKKNTPIQFEIAETGAKAQTMIADRSIQMLGIFINLRVSRPGGISVIKAAYYHRPATPVYMIQEEGSLLPLSPADLRSMGVRDVISKSEDYEKLLKIVAPVALSFDAQEILKNTQKSAAVAGVELEVSDEGYSAISAFDFISGSQSLFDVFVRLNSGRYLKLLDAGDTFEASRIENYLKKGVTHFYIQKEAQEGYLQFCTHIADKIAKSTGISQEIKITQTLNVGDQAMSFFKDQGVSEANIKYATAFVGLIHNVMKDSHTQEDPVSIFMQNADAYEHGVSTAMAAAILSSAIEITFDKPAQIIGVAAMLHDIGLYQLPEVLWHEDESQMTPDQRKLYRTHPKLGADTLRGLKRFDSAALQAVELHHQRRDGKGFPEIMGIGMIPRVAEVVGICDQFDLALRLSRKNPSFNLRDYMEAQVFTGFSKQIVYAFRTAIFPRAHT